MKKNRIPENRRTAVDEQESERKNPRKNIVKCIVYSSIYLAWVVWMQNPWWLLGLPVIFDLYVSKKIRWAFWKQRCEKGKKRNIWLDWLDAAIFALIVATVVRTFFIEAYVIPSPSMEKSLLVGDYLFVSKVAYGPKMPNTPLSIPLVHNRIKIFGIDVNSYSQLISYPYKRLAGWGRVQRNDIVVFNFPHGDTVIRENPDIYDYHMMKRGNHDFDNWMKINNYTVIARPVDKRDNYVKRCVATPGDVLEIRHGDVFVNGEPQVEHDGREFKYRVTANAPISREFLIDRLGLSRDDMESSVNNTVPLTQRARETLERLPSVVEVRKEEDSIYNDEDRFAIFPFSPAYPWTEDNYGPLKIPAKGTTVALTAENLCLYRRIIAVYECNTLAVRNDSIYINGVFSTDYTFKMDYYFMMGDNRHNSADSRFWGFVPEDHIVGKPSFIWFSTDRDKRFPRNIRWNRIFRGIN